MKIVKILFILVLSSFVLSSCEKDDELKVADVSIKVNKLEGSVHINNVYNDFTCEVVFSAVYDIDYKSNSDIYYSGYYGDKIYVKYGTDSSLKNAEMVNMFYESVDSVRSELLEFEANKKYYYQVGVKISPNEGNENNEEFWVYDKIRELDLTVKNISQNVSIKANYLGTNSYDDRQMFSISVTGSPFGKDVSIGYDFWGSCYSCIIGGSDPENLYNLGGDCYYRSNGVWDVDIDNREEYVGEKFYYKPCIILGNDNIIYGELSSVVLK